MRSSLDKKIVSKQQSILESNKNWASYSSLKFEKFEKVKKKLKCNLHEKLVSKMLSMLNFDKNWGRYLIWKFEKV